MNSSLELNFGCCPLHFHNQCFPDVDVPTITLHHKTFHVDSGVRVLIRPNNTIYKGLVLSKGREEPLFYNGVILFEVFPFNIFRPWNRFSND